jgi:hypothetical protein
VEEEVEGDWTSHRKRVEVRANEGGRGEDDAAAVGGAHNKVPTTPSRPTTKLLLLLLLLLTLLPITSAESIEATKVLFLCCTGCCLATCPTRDLIFASSEKK